MAKRTVGQIKLNAAGYTSAWYRTLVNVVNGAYPDAASGIAGMSAGLGIKTYNDGALLVSDTDATSLNFSCTDSGASAAKYVLVLAQQPDPEGGYRVTLNDGTQVSPALPIVADAYALGETQPEANSAATAQQMKISANAGTAYNVIASTRVTPRELTLKMSLADGSDGDYSATTDDVTQIVAAAQAALVAKFAEMFKVKNNSSEPTPAASNNPYYKFAAVAEPLVEISFATQVTDLLIYDVQIDESTGELSVPGLGDSGASGASEANNDFEAFKADKLLYDRYLATSIERCKLGLWVNDITYLVKPVTMNALTGPHAEIARVWWESYQVAVNSLKNLVVESVAYAQSGSELSQEDWKLTELSRIDGLFASDDSSSWWQQFAAGASKVGGKVVDYATNQSPTEWVKAGTAAYVATSVASTFDKKWIAWGAVAFLTVMVLK